jgi:hypothetical protein
VLSRIQVEFVPRLRRDPSPLLRVTVPDTHSDEDAWMHAAETWPSGEDCAPVVLAELPDLWALHVPQGVRDGLSGFFDRARRVLQQRERALLLVACRQQHQDDGELSDPCGQVIACGRSAGFVYRQHILVVHATASGNRLHPTPDAPAGEPGPWWRHRTIHTDLLVFTPA